MNYYLVGCNINNNILNVISCISCYDVYFEFIGWLIIKMYNIIICKFIL